MSQESHMKTLITWEAHVEIEDAATVDISAVSLPLKFHKSFSDLWSIYPQSQLNEISCEDSWCIQNKGEQTATYRPNHALTYFKIKITELQPCYLFTASGCFCTVTAELSICIRNSLVYKATHMYHTWTFTEKNALNFGIQDKSRWVKK